MDAIVTKFVLKIDLSLEEVMSAYMKAFLDQDQVGNGRGELERRREAVMTEAAGARTIEAVVVDYNEFLGRRRARGSHDDVWEGGHLQGTGIDPGKVPGMLQELGDYRPAGLWETCCFGLEKRTYFGRLKHNPKWLIAPLKRYNHYSGETILYSGAAAVQTSEWNALSWYYGEPQYPRVLGYKVRRRSK